MFHLNISFGNTILKQLLLFCKIILINSRTCVYSSPKSPFWILNELLLFKRRIKLDNNVVYYRCLFERNINFAYQLFDKSGVNMNWNALIEETQLGKKHYFQWMQSLHALSNSSKLIQNTSLHWSPRNKKIKTFNSKKINSKVNLCHPYYYVK